MFCEKCGNEIETGAKFCQHCGGVITDNSVSIENVAVTEFVGTAENDVVDTLTLISSKYVTLKSFSSFVISEINFMNDRMEISMKPKSYNKIPTVMYNDICDISVKNKIFLPRIIVAIILVICGIISMFTGIWGFIFFIITIVFAYKSINQEIVLSLKDGRTLSLFCHEKSDVVEFKNKLNGFIRR